MAESNSKKKNLAVNLLVGFDFYIAYLRSFHLLYDTLWDLGYDVDLEGQKGHGFTVLEKANVVADELSGAYQDVVDFAKSPKSFSLFKKAFKALVNIAQSGVRINEVLKEEGIDPEASFGKDFFPSLGMMLALKILEFFSPQVYHALVLATVIRPGFEGSLKEHLRDENGKIIRFPHAITEVDFSRISDLFDDPVELFKQEYLTETDTNSVLSDDEQLEKISKKLFKRLQKFLTSINANAVYGLKPADWLDFEDPVVRQINERTLSFWFEFLGKTIEVGSSLAFQRQDNGDLGLGVLPFGGLSKDFDIKGWTMRLDATLFVDPFVINGVEEQETGNSGRLEIKLSKGTEAKSAYVIGGDEESHLELGQINIEGGFDISSENKAAGVLVEFEDSKIVIHADPQDGFQRKIIPEKGITIDFDIGIGWSNVYGFYINGGTGLEVEFSKHIDFARIFSLTALQLGINASKTELRIYNAISANVTLGPFLAKVDTMGIQALWTFPDKETENPKTSEFDFDFKPPKGVGIKVNAEAVKGGGFLFFDKEKGQYSGVADLTIPMFGVEVSVKAVGIINTKAADGSEGFSFLLLISGEFSPVQLGAGFTWSGVGGLIGINRAMNTDAIRLGVRDKTLDNILFPENPLENAKQIIVSANTVFPMQNDRYVFGIMAILGWGAQNLVTLELGILVEATDPWKLAIVGVAKASLSKKTNDKELSVLKLQVNFAGIIDFDKNFFSFDANLFDSTVLTFRLEGDLAIRVQWGESKCFLMSIGGFHPDFNDIPQSFPSMTRLMMPLVDRKRAQVILTFYMAITPNSFQIGAGVFFLFKISKFTLQGELSFDALFYSRSNFLVLVKAELEVRWGSRTLIGVTFKGSFAGTSPWDIIGTAKIKLLFWSKTFNIDKTYGEEIDTSLPPIILLPELKRELEDKRNWQQVTPAAVNLLVTVKDDDLLQSEKTILLHPTGGVAINQTLLPLNIRLNKFAAQNIDGANRFDLEMIDGNDNAIAVSEEKDMFPPAMFLDLSDEEKLSRKSYESLPSGIKMKQADQIKLGGFTEKPVQYESKVFDGVSPTAGTESRLEDSRLFNFWSTGNTVAQSEVGATARFNNIVKTDEIKLQQEEYILVYNQDLTAYSDWSHRSSQTEAIQILEDVLVEHPDLENQISVVPAHEMA